MHDVIEGVIAPYGGTANGRFKVSGPSLRLQPRAAVALSMGLHELTTNALNTAHSRGRRGRWRSGGRPRGVRRHS